MTRWGDVRAGSTPPAPAFGPANAAWPSESSRTAELFVATGGRVTAGWDARRTGPLQRSQPSPAPHTRRGIAARRQRSRTPGQVRSPTRQKHWKLSSPAIHLAIYGLLSAGLDACAPWTMLITSRRLIRPETRPSNSPEAPHAMPSTPPAQGPPAPRNPPARLGRTPPAAPGTLRTG